MSEKYSKPSLATIKDELHYDCLTGYFNWMVTRNRIVSGQRAGTIDAKGYRRIRFRGDMYFAHHLAFFFINGRFSKLEIDHFNGNRDDNKPENLREATRAENAQNTKIKAKNKLGFMGVSYYHGRYAANVKINGLQTRIGVYNNPSDAHEAYKIAKSQHHKFFNANRMIKL